MLPYVRQLTRVLSERLSWNRARMKLMARLMRAIPIQTTTNLAELALMMKPQVETDLTYRRLQRFFADFAFEYEALGRFLLALVPSEPPYVVVIDRTEWHFGQTAVNVLMIGIAEGGIAYPIAWTALGHGGGSGSEEHAEVLEQFLRVVEPEQIEALVADREFTGADFLRRLKEREVPFVIRIKTDRRVGPPLEEASTEEASTEETCARDWSLPVRMFARTCHSEQSRLLEGEQALGGAKSVESQVAMKRLEEESKDNSEDNSFLILVARGIEAEEAERLFDLYRRRWEIETLFAALKSRGFDLEATHLTEPDRIRKLLGVVVLTYSWLSLPTVGLGSAHWDRSEKARGLPSRLHEWLSGEEPLPLRSGSTSRAGDQLVSDAGRTQSLYSSTRVPELIFVV